MSTLDAGQQHAQSYHQLRRYPPPKRIGVAEALAAEEDLVRSTRQQQQQRTVNHGGPAEREETSCDAVSSRRSLPQHHSAMLRDDDEDGECQHAVEEVEPTRGCIGGGKDVSDSSQSVSNRAAVFGGVTAAAKKRASASSPFRRNSSSSSRGIMDRWMDRESSNVDNSSEVDSSIDTAVATSASSDYDSTAACRELSIIQHPPLVTTRREHKHNNNSNNNNHNDEYGTNRPPQSPNRKHYHKNTPQCIPDENTEIFPKSTTSEWMHKRKLNKREKCSSLAHPPPPPPVVQRSMSQTTLSKFQSEMKYYRIVYRGVVALLSQPDVKSAKSGAYVGYGEIIATKICNKKGTSSHATLFSPPFAGGQQQQQQHAPQSPRSSVYSLNSCSLSSLDTRTTGTASAAAAAAMTLPLGPPPPLSHLLHNQHHNLPPHYRKKQHVPYVPLDAQSQHEIHKEENEKEQEDDMVVIRVDEVLTGGYAADAVRNESHPTKLNDHDHDDGGGAHYCEEKKEHVNDEFDLRNTPRRSNHCQQQQQQQQQHGRIVSDTPGSVSWDKKTTTTTTSSSSTLPCTGYTSFGRPSPYHASPSPDPNNKQSEVEEEEEEGQHIQFQSQRSSSSSNNNNRPLTSNSSPHHGYLFLKRGDVVVAEPLSMPPPICQHGAFFYKVCSAVPVPILTGPCLDAPTTRAMALPGTVHEVSLRISGVENDNENDYENGSGGGGGGGGGGIIFLRLSHRRGWIPDRKVSGGERRSSSSSSTDNRRGNRNQRVTIVMKEIIDGEEASRFGGSSSFSCCDEEETASVSTSVASSSIASSSIATPAALMRRRRPVRRRRERAAGAANVGTKMDKVVSSGAPVQRGDPSGTMDPASQRGGIKNSHSFVAGTGGVHDALASPASNVSILTNDSFFNRSSVGPPPPPASQDLKKNESFVSSSSSQQPNRHRRVRSNTSAVADDAVSTSTSFDKHDNSLVASARAETLISSPSYFLMRVTAPKGLKILDAPHFQVNKLIHGQSGSTAKFDHGTSSGSQPSSKPHHSIFHTMAGSLTTESSSDGHSVPLARVLPRGILFEATRRQETAGIYTPGSGLIKLADNSGWAIVPHKDDLDYQYRGYNGGVAGVREGEATRAYEELGNSIVVPSTQQNDTRHTIRPAPVWLRILPRNGVLVSCTPPSQPDGDEDNMHNGLSSPSSSMEGSSTTPPGGARIKGPVSSNDSEVASSIGSSFFDAVFRTPRKHDGQQIPQKEAAFSGEKKGADRLEQKQSSPRSMTKPVLVCGLCVAVDPWEEIEGQSTSVGVTQSFARLCGGQGWIPRQPAFAVEVERPDIRQGSFWFRVQSTRGIKVRQGPSRRSNPIKSNDDVYFRFECGEFLRASEVITVFSPSDQRNLGNESVVEGGGSKKHTSECFAKLYRRKHSPQPKDQAHFPSLTTLTAPGEWVQVHSNDRLYLEECMTPPSIERCRQGWRYNAISESGAQVRKGPSFLAERTEKVLHAGESVLINERVTAHGEGVTWLRLKDGLGWVHDVGENNDVVMIAHSLRQRTRSGSKTVKSRIAEKVEGQRNDGSYNSIIARLFQNEGLVLGDVTAQSEKNLHSQTRSFAHAG